MIFTDTERCILESTKKDYKWIARDKDGELYIYASKPFRFVNRGVFDTGLEFDDVSSFSFVECFSDNIFSNVTWENSPIQFRDDEPLTPKEREFLKLVFKPFASDIAYVLKNITDNGEFIGAYLRRGEKTTSTMFRGMKPGKPYSLKELGINYDE